MSLGSSMQPDSCDLPPDLAVIEIRTTFPTRTAAEECGARLVARRLAACAQIDGPLTSTYRWQGAVETAEEFSCRVKTTPETAAACEAEIVAMHPYSTPEILATVSRASAPYAAWVRENVGAPDGRPA